MRSPAFPETCNNNVGDIELAARFEESTRKKDENENKISNHRFCRRHRIQLPVPCTGGVGEIAGLRLTDVDGERLTVNQSVWGGKDQSPKTNSANTDSWAVSQLISLLWEQIARQSAKGHEYLFSASTGRPVDMNGHRRRKMTALPKSLVIPQAGFHTFRHFNVSLLDALRVPLKTVEERAGDALTGSFTLDVYGGQPNGNGILRPDGWQVRRLREP